MVERHGIIPATVVEVLVERIKVDPIEACTTVWSTMLVLDFQGIALVSKEI